MRTVTTQEILTRLTDVRGPNPNGNYAAKCPAHNDCSRSLIVRRGRSEYTGRARTYVSCMAGCSETAIMQAVGLTCSDLLEGGWKHAAG